MANHFAEKNVTTVFWSSAIALWPWSKQCCSPPFRYCRLTQFRRRYPHIPVALLRDAPVLATCFQEKLDATITLDTRALIPTEITLLPPNSGDDGSSKCYSPRSVTCQEVVEKPMFYGPTFLQGLCVRCENGPRFERWFPKHVWL